jgi:hypothetical protein
MEIVRWSCRKECWEYCSSGSMVLRILSGTAESQESRNQRYTARGNIEPGHRQEAPISSSSPPPHHVPLVLFSRQVNQAHVPPYLSPRALILGGEAMSVRSSRMSSMAAGGLIMKAKVQGSGNGRYKAQRNIRPGHSLLESSHSSSNLIHSTKFLLFCPITSHLPAPDNSPARYLSTCINPKP